MSEHIISECPPAQPLHARSQTDRSQPDIRERIDRYGIGAISTQDLVVAILGTGLPGRPVRLVAREVLDLITHGPQPIETKQLMEISGMGRAKSCAIAAAIELGRRLFSYRGIRISSPRDMFPLLLPYADHRQEHFIVASLNGGHEINMLREVTKGLINRTMIHPREVFADPITDRACAIIVAHNHPSGNLEPSSEDIEITGRLCRSGDILGIPVLDHLVFCENGYYSFVEHNLIAPADGRA